jgi:hypothetical protein
MRKIIFVMLAAALASYLVSDKISFGSSSAADDMAVYQLVAADGKARTVVWLSESTGEAFLEYRLKGTGESVRVMAEQSDVKGESEGRLFRYFAAIDNLAEGASYEYRVGKAGAWSKWHDLRAESGGELQAVIFGDSQSTDYSVWQSTAERAMANNAADFFINMGDLVDNGAAIDQWQAWLDGIKSFSASVPLAPVSGNHENYTLKWQFGTADIYNSLFKLPQNGIVQQNGWYSFDFADCHFSVLDTQEKELKEFAPDLLIRQAKWLKDDLAKEKAKWKIVLMHRPPFDADGNLNEIGKIFVPLFDEYGVAVVFTAHNHAYLRTPPLKNNRPSSDGCVYISTGRSGDVFFADAIEKSCDSFFMNPTDSPMYIVLSVKKNRLSVSARKANGEIFDEMAIKKPAASS